MHEWVIRVGFALAGMWFGFGVAALLCAAGDGGMGGRCHEEPRHAE